MMDDRLAAFLEHHRDGWNRRDPATLSRDYSKEGVILSPMFGRVEGRAAIRETYVALFAAFPDWTIKYDSPVTEGNRFGVSFSVTATHQGDFMGLPGTGRRCSFEGISLFRLNPDLLIVEERRVYDFTGLLTQVGVLRLRPA